MPSPFPGMDPYLEDPAQWGNVHHGILSQSQAALNAQLRPRYYARVEERVYIPPPDDPARPPFRVPDVQIVRDRARSRKPERSRANGGGVATAPIEIQTMFPGDEIHEYYL